MNIKSKTHIINSFSVLVLLLLAGFFTNCYSQTVTGKVSDSLKIPLENANILAIPESENEEIRFSITDNFGNYRLKLSSNQTYELTVSYLGFKSQTHNISVGTKNLNKNFTLLESPQLLGEVIVNYTPPIIIKKDTIIYDVTKFATGEERKLKDLLKKLPGVEVDKAGNVKVNGKKVTKVLVEDNFFFTGNSRLAINNIPADAVDKVEVLDNYNEVAMLKGLQDTDDIAMNIKLKEDKKNFTFGDIEVGAGIKERYLAHPNLFYYSPKTNINLIGDINNRGVKSFTIKEYLEFEGGFGKLLNDINSYVGLFNSDFAQFLNNQDFKANINQFGALNVRQSINNNLDVSGYIIASNSKTDTESANLNTYQNIDFPYTEKRTIVGQLNNFFTIGKITLDYEPSSKVDFAYNSFVKLANNDINRQISTVNLSQSNNITAITNVTELNLKQNISFSRKLSKSHTGTLEVSYNFHSDKPMTEWITNQQILQGLIPLLEEDVYNILQNKKSKSHNFNAILKDYWVLNGSNHLYTSTGVNTSFNDFYTNDLQVLSDGSVNNFDKVGFGNDFNYNFIDTFLGFEYKFLTGKSTFKPALYCHWYLWSTEQFNEAETFSKTLLLPQFTFKVDFSNSEKLNFRYRLNARFSGVNQLANNFVLSSFNSVYRGNNQLENQLYHSAYLSYNKSSLFKGLNFNINTSYNKRINTINTITKLNGIESFNTPVLFTQPEQRYTIGGRLTKKINKVRYKLSSIFRYNDFFQLVNDNVDLNVSKSTSSSIGIETLFKNFPNIEINYTKDFSNYEAQEITNKFENDRIEINLEYDFFKDFIFKADYIFDNYNNKNQKINNTFNIANASLFYQIENSPWGFEINATNLFDMRFKQQNSFNSFLISDQKVFVLPRIWMFSVIYKL